MELRGKKAADEMINDEQIIELYWSRNEQAIIETDRKYGKYLFVIANNILHNFIESEKCLTDTYLNTWNAIPPTRPNVLKAFLITIMRRCAINRYHKMTLKSAVPSEMTVALSELDEFLSDDDDIDERLDSERLGTVISDFIRLLSERRRYIFFSRYYMAESIDRIASDLRLSRSTINKELAVIRSLLKEKLESEGYSI